MKRLKWTDKKITKAIRRVQKESKLKDYQMPTKTEIDKVTGDGALWNAIRSHGGARVWADKLKLEKSNSRTRKASKFEKMAQKTLYEKTGVAFRLTEQSCSYDLYAKGVKIDVKAVERKYTGVNRTNYCHEFTNTKDTSECDFYMLICNNAKVVDKILILPAACFDEKQIIHITKNGRMSDSYNYFIDKYRFITDQINFNTQLIRKIPRNTKSWDFRR